MGTKSVGESWFEAEFWEVLRGLVWPPVRVVTSWRRKRWGWREVPGYSFQTLCSLNAEIQPRSVNPKALNSESGLRFFALLRPPEKAVSVAVRHLRTRPLGLGNENHCFAPPPAQSLRPEARDSLLPRPRLLLLLRARQISVPGLAVLAAEQEGRMGRDREMRSLSCSLDWGFWFL